MSESPATQCKQETAHKYRVTAWWTSGQTGIAKSQSAPNAIHFTAPLQFGGLEGRWTPEDLLMGALASCFTTTFHALAGYAKFEYTDLSVEAEGAVSKAKNGYCFNEIVVRSNLKIPNEKQRDQALKLLARTQMLCLVSRALALPPTFQFSVEISVLAGNLNGCDLPVL